MSIKSKQLLIYGAGGFSREIDWLTESSPSLQNATGYIDDNAKHGDELYGKPVLQLKRAVEMFPHANVVVSIADVLVRRKIVRNIESTNLVLDTLIHDSVPIPVRTSIGEGSIICAGNIISPDVSIGKHVHLNLSCTVGHDCIVSDFTTISPGVHISGNVYIGQNVFIGTGANIIQGSPDNPLQIADGTIIGAGACIIHPTEENGLYVGVPAIKKA